MYKYIAFIIISGSMASCGVFDSRDIEVQEGDGLSVTVFSSPQPSSRSGYAGMAVYDLHNRTCILRTGTGPSDLPSLVRCIELPESVTSGAAQIDKDGYLWITTPDRADGGPHNQMYVVDPHLGVIHRVVSLPDDVRGVADIAIGPSGTYVRAWRNGFSGGIGVIDRRCTSDENFCSARLLTELGSVGVTLERALYLDENILYSFSPSSSQNEYQSLDRIELSTGSIVNSFPFVTESVADDAYFYMYAPLAGTGEVKLLRLNKQTFDLYSNDTPVGRNRGLMALWDDKIYMSSYNGGKVDVYDKNDLSFIRTFDVSSAGKVWAVFGFVSPGVLLINNRSVLLVDTGEVRVNLLEDQGDWVWWASKLRLAEGQAISG